MAIDAAHRSSLYQKFVPLLGEEDANVLMSEFPASDADELVTKQFVRAELAELRTEFHVELGRIRAWTVGTMLAGMSVAAAIGALSG